jgi:hypothetical protein
MNTHEHSYMCIPFLRYTKGDHLSHLGRLAFYLRQDIEKYCVYVS